MRPPSLYPLSLSFKNYNKYKRVNKKIERKGIKRDKGDCTLLGGTVSYHERFWVSQHSFEAHKATLRETKRKRQRHRHSQRHREAPKEGANKHGYRGVRMINMFVLMALQNSVDREEKFFSNTGGNFAKIHHVSATRNSSNSEKQK